MGVKFRSLRTTLLLYIIMTSAVFTAVLTAFSFYFDYRTEVAEHEGNLSSVEELMVPSVTKSLYDADVSSVQLQLDNIIKMPSIVSVSIKTPEGERQFFSGSSPTDDLHVGHFVKRFKLVHAADSIDLGEMEVVASHGHIFKKLLNKFYFFVITQGCKTFLISFVILYIFSHFVTQHLVKLVQVMSKKDLKPEDCAFDDISHYGALNNELTVLADSFKRMITDVRAVEEEKTALIEKLKNSSMNAARLAAMGQMTATVVHDIKNPLGVIGGNIFLLKKSLSSGTVEREKIEIVLDKIEMSVHKINQIVTSVMNQSRDAKNDPFEQLPVVKIFSELMVLSEERFNRHGVKLMVMMPPEDLIISCRPVEISRVLVNLVNNALDAVKEQDGSWVKVSADQDGRYCKIYVTDCGYGIEKSVVDQMFEPFFTTKSRLMGTGLGLYISEQLIKNNQGTLRIDDKNPNTCFVITLSLLPLELKDTIA